MSVKQHVVRLRPEGRRPAHAHRRRDRAGPLDAAAAGGPARGVGGGGPRLPRDGARHAKNNELKPWLTERWCIPAAANAAYVAAMETVTVTERRTRLDFADALKALVDVEFPDAERIVLVLDNLNTHHPASLDHRFPPAEAKPIRDRLESHHTPKHGSWLNIAEIELSVLSRQWLDRRLPDRAALEHEVAAWTRGRNAVAVRVDWHSTTEDARIKLRHRYPVLEPISNPTTTL